MTFQGLFFDEQMAAKIKTLDTYPKQQMDLINLKITEQTNSNIQSQYQNLIKSADELLLDSSYEQAIQKYDEANEISPNESYPIQKIREIKRLMGISVKHRRGIVGEIILITTITINILVMKLIKTNTIISVSYTHLTLPTKA